MKSYCYKPTALMLKDSYYDKERADIAVNFIQSLCHTKGQWTGQRFILLPWQEQIVRDLFGIIRKNGLRQFTTGYVEIPKKAGKSELAAAIALYMLCADGEERAEVYGCAADRQQAMIVYEVACDMVRQSPALAARIKLLSATKRMLFRETNSVYQVLSSDAYSKHGLNISAVIFDELHAQPDRRLYDVMTKGSGDARLEPLFFFITTAGDNIHSICYEIHQKALDIIEGRKTDPAFYPVIYGASADEDWTNEAVWEKANPSIGVTFTVDKLRTACEQAKSNPADENTFRQLRLNQWVKQAVRWMPMHQWDKCGALVDEQKLQNRRCFGGLDLSSTGDLTSFVLVFPPIDEYEPYYVLPFFWIPKDNLLQRVRRDHVHYDLWEKQGLIKTTEGNVIHYAYIEKFIFELSERFDIVEIAYDRWGATQLAQNLENMGFTVVQFGQGFASMSPPSKELFNLVQQQKIAHGGNPVLHWNMDNVTIRMDPAGNIKPDKGLSTERIDGVVALIMALDRAIRVGNNPGGSVYNDKGLFII